MSNDLKLVLTYAYVGDFPSEKEVAETTAWPGVRLIKTNPFGALLITLPEDGLKSFLAQFKGNWKLSRVDAEQGLVLL